MLEVSVLGWFRVCEWSHKEMEVILRHHPHWCLSYCLLMLLKSVLERGCVWLVNPLSNNWSGHSANIIWEPLLLLLWWWIGWADIIPILVILKYIAHERLMLKLLSGQAIVVLVFIIHTPIRGIPSLHISLILWIERLSVFAMKLSTSPRFNYLFNWRILHGRAPTVVFLPWLVNHRKLCVLYEMLLLLTSVCCSRLRRRHF